MIEDENNRWRLWYVVACLLLLLVEFDAAIPKQKEEINPHLHSGLSCI